MRVRGGVEGVVGRRCCMSCMMDDRLTYVGYEIEDLAENGSLEEVI
ncbi:hypothetical protein [Cytobacillus oceanisediminis]|nr:hypothetical protein [Cytobacillus oceanisediminis]